MQQQQHNSVEMKWNKTSKELNEIGLQQELLLECDAIGSPEPKIEWFKDSQPNPVAHGRQLKKLKVSERDSGFYECVAKNGVDDDLRKIIQVKVRGKFKIDDKIGKEK